ncbi:hypothetical protein ACK6S7_06365 [Proteus mirabilis]|uniref:hypothetical protein n=1 Tax=Proteus mirabilis TaxID=584 RepID=UPI0039B37261
MNRLNVLKKYKRYLYTLIIVALFGWIGWFVWLVLWEPPQGGVSLVIHTQIDRPIRGFSVNGVAGGNAFAYGGGATTCCGSISGDTAEIIWTVDYT